MKKFLLLLSLSATAGSVVLAAPVAKKRASVSAEKRTALKGTAVQRAGAKPASANRGAGTARPPAVAGPIANGEGVAVSYQLPTTGPLPQTYRVTLAIVDAKRPGWIISQFAAGVARTVTARNGGKFTETWNGLDDNFMPVPPGSYGVKGIYMTARKWDVDGEYHSVVPRYLTSAEAWRALPGENKVPVVVGDPVNSPMGDVDVASNGIGVFCYTYLENSRNYYVADFKKPINYDQVSASYGSGGAAGGDSVATDGLTSWCRDNEGFIFRTDGKAFGKNNGRYRAGVYQPQGHVTSMAAWRDEAAGKSFLYVAERGRISRDPAQYQPTESATDKINKLQVLDGDSAAVLASLDVEEPLGLVARRGDRLWVLHRAGGAYVVSAVALKAGLPDGGLQPVFTVPAGLTPSDLEVDSHGRMYLADAKANHVYQFAPDGRPLLTFGRLAVQTPGSYDAQTFMSPERLSCWRDAAGRDHLIVVEKHGPDRVSEWSAEDGKLEREWLSAQTFANAGYAVDPRQPDRFYIQGHGGYLMRLKVDYTTGGWTTEAVWPDVATGRFSSDHSGFPRMLYRGNVRYLAWPRGDFIYREAGNRWLASAAILSEKKGNETKRYLWSDANGDGQVQDEEYLPHVTAQPPGTQRYWGNSWLDDFSYAAIGEGSSDVWRLPAASFDVHGNPQYKPDGWTKLLTDQVLQARRDNTATALLGGNEIGDRFSSAWAMVEGNTRDGFYVNARGPDLSANFGAQQKLSKYVPDGKGGYRMVWRVGRMAVHGTAEPGELYGSIHVMPPIGGLVTQIDQSRMGLLLYTDEGLYVDTLFPDERIVGQNKAGPYNLPGEFFTGYSFLNKTNNKVYLALGKTTPMLFEATGWTGTSNPARPLETLPKSVSLTAANTAAAPEFALALRRGGDAAAAARVARFAPLPGGGPALDGSLKGWETCEPLVFAGGEKQTVEVRAGFDRENLYLRWHARVGHKLEIKPLAPVDRVFTHDRKADTVSFYMQGDVDARPANKNDARPGDVRLVFGLFESGGQTRPAVVGMYPKWSGPDKATPRTYRTPAGGAAVFEHVGLLDDVKLGHTVDADGEGFVIAAAIPRSRVPMLPPVTGELRTLVNFDATLGGHNRFWWSNADGSATRETYDEPTEARLYPGSWSQAQFAAMTSLPIRSWSVIGPFGFEKMPSLDHSTRRDEVTRTLGGTKFPPEQGIDLNATYSGGLTQTRKQMRTLKWRRADISGDRVKFGTALDWNGYEDEGTAYLATWIYAPAATTLKFRVVEEHGHHALRAWINDVQLPEVLPPGRTAAQLQQGLDPNVPMQLQAGWNKVLLRWDQVWGGNEVGLVLEATPEQLWPLKFSAVPPAG